MRKVSVITAALAMILAVAAPVAAAPPEGVTLEGPSYFTGTGEFTTTDEAGLICPSGITTDIFKKTSPPDGQSPNRINLQIRKLFACGDGSGSFEIKLQVQIPVNIDMDNWPTFTWVVVDGTGEYEDLKGNGSGFAAFPIFGEDLWPIGVYDVYQGHMHFPGN